MEIKYIIFKIYCRNSFFFFHIIFIHLLTYHFYFPNCLFIFSLNQFYLIIIHFNVLNFMNYFLSSKVIFHIVLVHYFFNFTIFYSLNLFNYTDFIISQVIVLVYFYFPHFIIYSSPIIICIFTLFIEFFNLS